MGVAVLTLVTACCLLCLSFGHAQRLPPYQQDGEELCGRARLGTALDEQEGRGKMKKKGRVLLSLLLGLKMLALSVVVPLIVALALYSAWKGVTISLLAFLIASIVGLKSLIGKSHDPGHNVIVAKVPGGGQEQWWRRLGADFGGLAGGLSLDPYRGYGLQPF